MASPLQFAYRTQKVIGVFDAAPVYEALPGFVKPESAPGNSVAAAATALRCMAYSPCGRFFAYGAADAVTVTDASVGHVLATLHLPHVVEIGFSSQGNYLSTLEKVGKDENGDATKNLKVWRTVEPAGGSGGGDGGGDGEDVRTPVGQFVQKSNTGWNLQYTADEKYCARMVSNEVQFYESHDLKTVWKKLRAEGVTVFAIGPGAENTVAVFVKVKVCCCDSSVTAQF